MSRATRPPARGHQRWRLALVLLLAGVLAGLWWSGVFDVLSLEWLDARRTELVAQVEAHPVASVMLYVVVYIVAAALSIPGAVILTLAGGALFGLAIGTIAVSVASTLGATAAFLVARFLLRDAIRKRFGDRLERIDQGVARDGAFYLFALRLVPAFPFWLINLVMGQTSIRVWTFFWVSQLGMLPATLVFVNAGTQLARIEQPGDVLSPGLLAAFVLLGVLPLVLRFGLRLVERLRVARRFGKPRRFDADLIIVGAGAAGLVAAYMGRALRAKVVLIESGRMGGDCLNTGCVPSKTLIRSARLLAEARHSERWGIRRMSAEWDFADLMRRVRTTIARIEPHDSRARYEELGARVIEGRATLVSPWSVALDSGERVTARAIVLATGARPRIPKLPGLAEAQAAGRIDLRTSDTIWDLERLPERLVVLGHGPVGVELAQTFARLGSQVTLVGRSAEILPREDDDAAECVRNALEADGVQICCGVQPIAVELKGGSRPDALPGPGRLRLRDAAGGEQTLAFDVLLVAVGREPRVEGFGLEAIGVALNEHGAIEHDGFLRTTVPNVFVCGDATGVDQFTHRAAEEATVAAINALLTPFWSLRVSRPPVPAVTFCDPELARAGLNERSATAAGVAFEVIVYRLDELDRAIVDGANQGFVKVLTKPGSDRILGVTIVAAHAGEMLPEFLLAMRNNIGLGRLLSTPHVYPTWSEGNRAAAGAWRNAHTSPRVLALLERFWRMRRRDATGNTRDDPTRRNSQ